MALYHHSTAHTEDGREIRCTIQANVKRKPGQVIENRHVVSAWMFRWKKTTFYYRGQPYTPPSDHHSKSVQFVKSFHKRITHFTAMGMVNK